MFDIEKNILAEKKRYLTFARQHEHKQLFIYGAGRMAKPLFLFLKKNGVKIKAFCVSDKYLNKKEECGLPIIQVDELNRYIGEKAVFLGVNSRLNQEIVEKLKAYKINDIMESTEYLRYFGEYQYDFYMNPMLEITTKIGCAVNCKYCPQDVLIKSYLQTGKESKYMSLDVFKQCIDKVPLNTLIGFAGFTEPFFNKDCLDMIMYVKERGYKINLFTTLRGVTQNIMEKITDIQFEEFVLHVPDNEGYSNIPITEEYLSFLDIVVNAKKPNGEVFIDYVCSQGTIPDIIRDHLGDNVRIFISLLDRAGNLKDGNLFGKRNLSGSLECEMSRVINHNVLLPDGRVVLCAQDYAMKHILGNLAEAEYQDVINGNEARKIIQCMHDKNDKSILCRNCSLAYRVD